MIRKPKTYKFQLYEEDLSNEKLIDTIKRAISTLPVTPYSYVIVELFKEDTELGIPFFQATHERRFKKTQYYTFEIRLDSDDGKHWRLYQKNLQTKEQVLTAFEEICVKRISPDLTEWEESKIYSNKIDPRNKNFTRLNEMFVDYCNKDIPTKIDHIKHLESLRYFVNYDEGYVADKWVLLAEQHCINGQYEKAKQIYESVMFAPDATFWLANMIMSGKLGKPNYKLAYEYYNHTCLLDEINYIDANIEIAKMHRDGKYFKPNYQIYKKMIKVVEKDYLRWGRFTSRLDKLYYELALIEQTDGNTEQAIIYCLKARQCATDILSYGYGEDLIVSAKRIIKLFYSLTEFNIGDANFYDLLYIMDSPFKITFAYDNAVYEIEGYIDKDRLIVKFDGKYYNGSTNFLMKATLDGHRLLHEGDKITIIEAVQ